MVDVQTFHIAFSDIRDMLLVFYRVFLQRHHLL